MGGATRIDRRACFEARASRSHLSMAGKVRVADVTPGTHEERGLRHPEAPAARRRAAKEATTSTLGRLAPAGAA